MEAKEQEQQYPEQIHTIYSVWIPSDRMRPEMGLKPFGDALLHRVAARDLARRYGGEVRELTV